MDKKQKDEDGQTISEHENGHGVRLDNKQTTRPVRSLSLFAFAMSFHLSFYAMMQYTKPYDHLCLRLLLRLFCVCDAFASASANKSATANKKMCVKLH